MAGGVINAESAPFVRPESATTGDIGCAASVMPATICGVDRSRLGNSPGDATGVAGDAATAALMRDLESLEGVASSSSISPSSFDIVGSRRNFVLFEPMVFLPSILYCSGCAKL